MVISAAPEFSRRLRFEAKSCDSRGGVSRLPQETGRQERAARVNFPRALDILGQAGVGKADPLLISDTVVVGSADV